MDSSLLKFTRRLNQGLQLFFSPSLTSAEAANKALQQRYGSAKEIEFYKSIAHCGFDDFEEKAINNALKLFLSPPTVLVIGCGTGREAFAFQQRGCEVTGIDPVAAMIEFAQQQANNKNRINCHFKIADPFNLPACHFDLVYISAAINGHILGRRERIRFYRRLRNFCHKKSLLISIPEIKEITPQSHFYWASLALRLRHITDGNWERGDTARSFLGNHNDDDKMLYYHYYPDHNTFTDEMQAAGFRRVHSENYIFYADQGFKPQVTHVAKYFPPDNHGGMESSLYDISCGAVKSGFQVKVICNSTSVKSSREKVRIENGELEIVRCARQAKISSSPFSATYLKELAEVDADLIHLHVPNPLASMTGLATTAPLVISYHCDVLSYPLLFNFYKPLLEQQLKRAKAIIVSSPQLIESSPVLIPYKEKCRIIPFGIEPKDFKVHQSIQNSLRELKNVYGKRLLLFVGRLVPYKGLEYLVNAMKNSDALLAIVGNGPELSALKNLTQKNHLEEKIHFFGSVPRADLGAYYKECDALVLPSIDAREAFGICLIEAMSFGKPLITTDLGTGVNFVNQDKVTGFSVPAKNSQALELAIGKLLNDNGTYQTLAKAAKERFINHFSREKMTAAYNELYLEILGHQLTD